MDISQKIERYVGSAAVLVALVNTGVDEESEGLTEAEILYCINNFNDEDIKETFRVAINLVDDPKITFE